jgi:hypothetical protein
MRLDVLEDPDRRYYTGLRDQRGLAAPAKYRGQLARDLHSVLDRVQDWVVSAPAERSRLEDIRHKRCLSHKIW